jgi:serine/threonine/tyrosine-interacting protein
LQAEEDWKYAMRREMQEISPGLFLGPYAAASRNQVDSVLFIIYKF